MARREEYQFDYPEKNWATGKMRTARRIMEGSGAKEFRELEGLRKEKGQRLSQNMTSAISSDANIAAGAGAISKNTTINAMDNFLQGQKNAQGQFDTILSPAEETTFRKWKQKHAPNDSGADYDLRGAFKAGFKPDEKGHWPDLYKKPNHPTFSDQSIYAKDAPDKAGRWEGENFIPPGGG